MDVKKAKVKPREIKLYREKMKKKSANPLREYAPGSRKLMSARYRK